MRADPALLKRLAQMVAVMLIGAAIAVTTAGLDRRVVVAPASEASADPLAAELERCRRIVRPEEVDDACRVAWAETRRRFFAPDPSREVRP